MTTSPLAPFGCTLSLCNFTRLVRLDATCPCHQWIGFHYVLQGIVRWQPWHHWPTHMLITMNTLRKTLSGVICSPAWLWVHLWAASTLGFFAFVCSGKFTVVTGENYPTLILADIQVDCHCNSSYVIVTIRSSKTDLFGAGCTLHGLDTHCSLPTASAGPLLIYSSGSPPVKDRKPKKFYGAITNWCLQKLKHWLAVSGSLMIFHFIKYLR